MRVVFVRSRIITKDACATKDVKEYIVRRSIIKVFLDGIFDGAWVGR